MYMHMNELAIQWLRKSVAAWKYVWFIVITGWQKSITCRLK